MSSSNCCFLTCTQVSQEAGQVVCYSLLFQNFPEFIVIHTVKGCGIVNKAKIDVFLELSCFFDNPSDVGSLISGSCAFSKTTSTVAVTAQEHGWEELSHIQNKERRLRFAGEAVKRDPASKVRETQVRW